MKRNTKEISCQTRMKKIEVTKNSLTWPQMNASLVSMNLYWMSVHRLKWKSLQWLWLRFVWLARPVESHWYYRWQCIAMVVGLVWHYARLLSIAFDDSFAFRPAYGLFGRRQYCLYSLKGCTRHLLAKLWRKKNWNCKTFICLMESF